jgi:hypothetical protein
MSQWHDGKMPQHYNGTAVQMVRYNVTIVLRSYGKMSNGNDTVAQWYNDNVVPCRNVTMV